METRSRKRAEASTPSPSPSSRAAATRSSKRPRTSSAAASAADSTSQAVPPSTRSRCNSSGAGASNAPVSTMDQSETTPARRTRRGGSDKGKETQEPSDSSRTSRYRERDSAGNQGSVSDAGTAAAVAMVSADEDMDTDVSISGFPPSLTNASSALHGLLRKLGAGLDDLLPSSALAAAAAAASSSSSSQLGGRLKKILSGLRADGEEGKQIEALTQLCDMLSIGTEESLGAFSVDSFVPVLVGLLNHENNPDIMLLAARALTHLCDVLPSSCSAVVHYNAVPCFCARLLTIEYMDLAEQCLQALKKISQEHPTACLRAGALMAVLSYLDFFSTGVQRVALATAANICRKLPTDAADFVMDAVPLLTNLLNYHDSKVLEHASVCLTRIAEAFASSPDRLDELCNHGLVAQAAGLVSVNSGGQASLSTSTYTGLIRLLSTCASGSAVAAKTLLLLGVSGTLRDILSGSGLVAGVAVAPAMSRPPDQVYEIVNLADELLPPLPGGTLTLPVCYGMLIKGSSAKRSPGTTSKKDDSVSASNEISPREKLLHEQPELLRQFGVDLLPILTQVYGSSVNGPIRYKCLAVVGKLMYYSSADMIQSLICSTNISSFLAGILAWKDPQVLVPALQISEILMEKLPETFSKMFVREGVVHAVDTLILPELSGSSPSQEPKMEKDNDSAVTSHSRRYRRRNTAANSENNSLDEPKGAAPVTIGTTPSSADKQNTSTSLRAAVSERAKSFKDKYFPADDGSCEVGVTDDLIRLKALCAKVNAAASNAKLKSKGKSKSSALGTFDILLSFEEHLDGVIAEMLTELSKGDGVSTFEFIGSGVVVSLLNYLSCGTFGKDKVSDANIPKLRQLALRRYKSFISIALPPDREGNESPMAILVHKLQNALSSVERFPVVLSHSGSSSSSGGSRLSSGLSALSQPFKLRLCRAPGEKTLRDYSSNIVLIDPLASLAAVEEFLWPRVHRTAVSLKPTQTTATNTDCAAPASVAGASSASASASANSARRPSTRSRSSPTAAAGTSKDTQEGNANTSKVKGKAVMKVSDDSEGPQTRNAARRKAALDKDVEMKPAPVEFSSEDDDLEASPADIDAALMIDEDDISEDDEDDHEVLGDGLPSCPPDWVHDVKLGEVGDDGNSVSTTNDGQAQPSESSNRNFPNRGAEATENRSPSAFGSRGAMSFAAAAMAGLVSVSGRSIRGSRDRRALSIGSSGNESSDKLVFTAGGKQLSKQLTVYQAVQRQLVLDEDDEEKTSGSDPPNDGSRFWSDIFTITYQKSENNTDKSSQSSTTASKNSKSSSSKSNSNSRSQHNSLLDSLLQAELPCDLEKPNATYNILALMRVLEGLNRLAPVLRMQSVSTDYAEGRTSELDDLYVRGTKVPKEEFANNKLTPKLARQIQDVLALCSGSLPSWCYQMTKACPFLFTFETRRQYFYSTAFGLTRALHRLQQQGTDSPYSGSERGVRVGRLQRQKVRVSRTRILDSAAKVMEMFSSQNALLEVEYFGEVGTGLGPTLEFYTLLSHDLQKVGLELWRCNSLDNSLMQIEEAGNSEGKKGLSVSPLNTGELIKAPLGLFPRPWPPNSDATDGSKFSKVIEHFRLVGRVMAKALQDGRLLDLPLSSAFYKLALGEELDLYDILSFDAEFGKVLIELNALACRKQFLELNGVSDEQIVDLTFRGASVEDLCLEFTLPGYPQYILKDGEENITVTLDNLEEYISLVVDATVKTGVMKQIEAFRSGFNQVFELSSLQIFSPHELDHLICGRNELWEPDSLVEHIKFDHGYTAKSPVIVNLLEIMAGFSPEHQHAFCQFVTGAPRLPPGGLAALNPKLTIVRKHPSSGISISNGNGAELADDDLPSVMTCANYLKLPPYSTKEVLYKKLLYAINEGQGSFDLS